MEGIGPFASTLGLILILELGDKTQLATISLATRHRWLPVFTGSAAGLVAVTAIGAAIGGALAAYLESWIVAIKIGGGALFILFGLWSYRKQDASTAEVREDRGPFTTAFALSFIAELGDKTQLAVVVLAAGTAAPISVFAGAAVGLTFIAATSVVIGASLAKVLQARWLRIISATLFIGAGVLLILEAILTA